MHQMILNAARTVTGRALIGLMLLCAAYPAVSGVCTKLAYSSVAADLATTVWAIESGNGVEANPIYPEGKWQYPAMAGVGLLRAWAIHAISRRHRFVPMTMKKQDGRVQTVYGKRQDDGLNCLVAGLGLAAAGNNAAIAAGRFSARDRLIGVGAGGAIAIGGYAHHAGWLGFEWRF